MQADNIGGNKRPEGAGSLVKKTQFVDERGGILLEVKDEILQKFEGQDIARSRPSNIIIIKLMNERWKIKEIEDISQNYSLSRVVTVVRPTNEELKGKTADVTI